MPGTEIAAMNILFYLIIKELSATTPLASLAKKLIVKHNLSE
jgi:hypothetical protein